MKVYYAHCMAIYNTPQEQRDLAVLNQLWPEPLGHIISNPSAPIFEARCQEIRTAWPGRPYYLHSYESAGEAIMDLVFRHEVYNCDLLVFRALPDGSVPAGVAREIGWAKEYGKPVLELPSGHLRRILTVAETKGYLEEVGQR